MSNLATLLSIIPSCFIIWYVGKLIGQAFKSENYYFVSYTWISEDSKHHGFGNIEIVLDELKSVDDIKEIESYLNDDLRSKLGNIKCIVLNIKKMSNKAQVDDHQVWFTDEGVKIKLKKDEKSV